MKLLLIALSGLVLAGCLEIAASADVQPNGAVQAEVEIAISAQLVAIQGALAKDRGQQGDMLQNCGTVDPKEEAPKYYRIVKASRGVRGDMMTCTGVLMIDDPVTAAAAFDPKYSDKEDGMVLESFSVTRLSATAYRLAAVIAEKPSTKTSDPTGDAMLAAMTANRFVSVTIRSKRIENTTGEMSPDGTSVTWKLPLLMLVKPPSGYRQEIKADVTYEESVVDRAKRFLGLQ